MANRARQSPDDLRALWNASPDAMVLTDAAGLVLAANPAYCILHGRLAVQLVGESLAVIFPEAARPSAMEHYHAVFESRDRPRVYPAVVNLRDTSQRLVESRIDFVTRDNRRSAMMSSVRMVDGKAGPASDDPVPDGMRLLDDLGTLHAGGPSSGLDGSSQTAADVVIEGILDWGIDVLFEPEGSAEDHPAAINLERSNEPSEERLDSWEDDGGTSVIPRG